MMKIQGGIRTCWRWPLLAAATVALNLIAAPLHADAKTTAVKSFASPKQAADALLAAATAFDVAALQELFGPALQELVLPDNEAEDRQRAAEFIAKARERAKVSVDPTTRTRAFLLVGDTEWPFPVPIVKRGTRWSFDTEAGRTELRNRRIGRNELDAIEICRGYVEAQHAYALQVRDGVSSTPSESSPRRANRTGSRGGTPTAPGAARSERPSHGRSSAAIRAAKSPIAAISSRC
jgi:hypothetical protein